MREKKKLNRPAIVLLCILLVGLAAAAIFYISALIKEGAYSEAIESAEKSIVQGDEVTAASQYKKAIETAPKNPEAYLKLAEIYAGQGNAVEARSILKKGYLKTNSPKIEYMINNVAAQNTGNNADGHKNGVVNMALASQNIAWNTSFLQKIESYDFADYKNEYGVPEELKIDKKGVLEAKHGSLGGICIYSNTDENKNIVDISRKCPTEKGMPEKLSLTSLNVLFRNFDGAVSLERLEMLIGKKIPLKQKEEMTIIEFGTESVCLRVETDEKGNIVSPNPWNEIILINANKDMGKANYSGVVIDAVTGGGVAGAKLVFLSAQNKKTEETTKDDGTFSLKLVEGTYRLTITAADYTEESFEVKIEKEKIYKGEQFTISPELQMGTARIVLEWGAEPTDLDLHLEGMTDDGDSVFVDYTNKKAEKDGKVIADLDVDTMTGYGPETITIYDLNGKYRIGVVDYTESQTMKTYGAVIKIYMPGKQPVTITLDESGSVEDLWLVCEIDDGTLKVLNTASAQGGF